MIKFGQKIFAQRQPDGEWEQGIVLKCDLPTVFIGFPDGTVWQVPFGRVKTQGKSMAREAQRKAGPVSAPEEGEACSREARHQPRRGRLPSGTASRQAGGEEGS